MAFSESIREEVRRKAAFQCCRCQNIGGVEAHHIIPQADGGIDTYDNAAPLCPTCHTEFGGNPDKRKEIRQMRDWWYEVVENKYGPSPDFHVLEDIQTKLYEVQKNQLTIEKFKQILKENALLAIDRLDYGTLASGATGIGEAAAASVSSSPSPSPEYDPKLDSNQGGDGGTIILITEKIKGGGNIKADGGDGTVGGHAGTVHITSKEHNFNGSISASGGKATHTSRNR